MGWRCSRPAPAKATSCFHKAARPNSAKSGIRRCPSPKQALSEDPADIAYQLATTRLRFYASQYHIDHGKKLRNDGQLDDALAEFQKAYGINPASSMAEEEISRTKGMIEREKNKPAGEQKPEERGMTPAQIERRREEKKFASMLPVPELRPLNPVPINLKMNNQPPKVLFETVGKLAGINVLFDPEYTTTGVPRSRIHRAEQRHARRGPGLSGAGDQIFLEAAFRKRHFRHPGQSHQASRF